MANGYVYDEGFENEDTPEILSVSDGRQVGSFADQTTPAFGSLNMYVFHKDTLISGGSSGKPNHWEFGNQTFAPVDAPVTDKSMVFIGAADGNVYGFSSNGTKKWTGVAGAAIDDIDGQPLTLGDGLLSARNQHSHGVRQLRLGADGTDRTEALSYASGEQNVGHGRRWRVALNGRMGRFVSDDLDQ